VSINDTEPRQVLADKVSRLLRTLRPSDPIGTRRRQTIGDEHAEEAMRRSVTRQLLYAAATNEWFERLVRSSPFLREAAWSRAQGFLGGETTTDVIATVHGLLAQGLAVSVDQFGEGLTEPAAIAAVVEEYMELGRATATLDGDVDVEVVPSNLGIDVSVEFFCEQARRIAAELPPGRRLQVSAEESRRTPRIIDAVIRLASEGLPVVATLQANLRRSAGDGERLVQAGVPIRLVKGAYPEPPDLAFAWGEPTDLAFVRLAHELVDRGAELSLATHDPVIREALLAGLNVAGVEMLLGVRSDDALDLVRRGHAVRVYVPYGSEWFRYWMRRVAEAQGA
jgi:proline dehydrogenase